jgi:hypothetical protein
VDLENQYYNSKALKEDDPKAALTSFQKVLDLEGGEKGEWGFKALKQMIKINFKLVSVQMILDVLYEHLSHRLGYEFKVLEPPIRFRVVFLNPGLKKYVTLKFTEPLLDC